MGQTVLCSQFISLKCTQVQACYLQDIANPRFSSRGKHESGKQSHSLWKRQRGLVCLSRCILGFYCWIFQFWRVGYYDKIERKKNYYKRNHAKVNFDSVSMWFQCTYVFHRSTDRLINGLIIFTCIQGIRHGQAVDLYMSNLTVRPTPLVLQTSTNTT